MDRRSLLKSVSLFSLLSLSNFNISFAKENRKKIKPEHLKKGDKVSIIAPGSAVSSPKDHYSAIEILERLELKYEFAPNLKKGSGYKTRSIKERVDDIHFAFESNSKAVFCIRGGYGSASLIPDINIEVIRSNPKIFAGFSDITALHHSIFYQTGLITFHSPVLLSTFSELSFSSFSKIMFGDVENYTISNPTSKSVRNSNPIISINEGEAKGELVGGNLSLISSLMGSENEIETENKLLFIEDVGEPPYRLHRMLTQLRLAGKFNNLNGVIIGKCDDCNSSSGSTWDLSEIEVYFDIFKDYKFPVMYGFLLGHTGDQFTLPLNVEYAMNTNENNMKLLENPFK
jgi:muramoyltetrapeptide carboxypeptidase